jgi:uncharacterized protein YndB with AHSA1/START domain
MADIIHRIGIKATPAQVYAALATVEGVAGWWTRETSRDGEGEASRKVRFSTHSGERAEMSFEQIEAKPERQVKWRFSSGPPEWIGTEVTFELTRAGEMTIVVFGHRHWRETVDFMAHCSMKWATFLLSLRRFVETGRGEPAPDDLKIDDWN